MSKKFCSIKLEEVYKDTDGKILEYQIVNAGLKIDEIAFGLANAICDFAEKTSICFIPILLKHLDEITEKKTF